MKVKTFQHLTAKPLFFWALLVVGATICGFYIFAGAMIYQYGTYTKDFGWQPVFQSDGVFISKVEAGGPAAGILQPGDRILAINGETRIQGGARYRTFWLNLYPIAPETTYTLRILRQNTEQSVELKVRLIRDYRILGRIACYLAVSLAFFLVGMLIGLSKPEDRVARLACCSSLTVAALPYFRVLEPLSVFFQPLELGIYYFSASVYPTYVAFAYHFYYRFPHDAPEARFWSFIKYVLYAWSVVLAIGYRGLDIITLQPRNLALSVFQTYALPFSVLDNSNIVFTLLGLTAICAVITRNYRLVTEPDQRRRIKWVVYGSTAGILPFVMLTFIELAGGSFPGLTFVAELAPLIIPVTLSYTIFKHRVFDIQVVIRRGVQYLLALNALRMLFALPLIWFGVAIFRNPDRTVREIGLQNPFLIVLFIGSAIGMRYRQPIGNWIDRKFFREAYNQEQIMLRLISEMKDRDSFSEISKLVNREVDAALHPKSFYVFERQPELREQTLVYTSSRLANQIRIPEEFHLLSIMEQEDQPLQYPFSRKTPLPFEELEWLEELGINLMVPMSNTDHRLIGLVLLGEKKSEEPYAPTDCKLLQVIAGQMGVVYENNLLKQRVSKEQTIKREVLARFEEQHINLVKECPMCGLCYDSSADRCVDDKSELTLSLPVERTIEGKYRLDKMIGKGGMGAVYEATDMRLNRKVAIKIILGSMFGDQAALKRFEREARAAAKLNHINVIAVYDYGRTSADGAFLVMEVVYGTSLRAELKRQGKIEPATAADWFHQLCEGIKAAHQAGIIHRDLKPENILIVNQENGKQLIKILDFGLAKTKFMDLADPKSLTAPGMVMGTFGYMSPEQFSGEDVDEGTDIFSLGVMVIEALTGRLPFRKKTMQEYLASLLFDEFHLEGKSPEVEQLDLVLQQCLAKERTDRFASVTAMQIELIPAMRQCPSFSPVERLSSEIETLDGSDPDALTKPENASKNLTQNS